MGSLEGDQGSPLEEGLLSENENKGVYTGDGSVDIHGNPVLKNGTGNWKACRFILGNESCERLAYYGTCFNLITYLNKRLHEGNASAARSITTWQGTCYITPLIGAILADAYWGRYWTIAAFSTVYFIGMVTLTLSATVPAFKPPPCTESTCPVVGAFQYAIFFIGLYLVALGTGGIKPCVSSFGADQFDDTDPRERVKKGSFFNWFYLSINIGGIISSTFIVWVQDNWGWGLGFGIPTLFMGLAIVNFFFGTPFYRFQKPGGSPILRICQVIVASFRKWEVHVPDDSSLLHETPEKASAIQGSRKIEHTDELRFLDKAATVSVYDTKSSESFSNPWRLCTVTQVEELKILVRMFPVWATTIVFFAVYAQISIFIEQGMVMNNKLGSITIPPASLTTFDAVTVVMLVPVYDRLLVPAARRFTGNEKGFSELQRLGIGLFISMLSMAAAAVVEVRRLEIATVEGVVRGTEAVSLNIFWQTPQYFLLGAAEVFTCIGSIEFFYNQSPDAMRSLCSALTPLTTAFGGYLSSFILTAVTTLTTRGGKPGWIPDDLNEGHLDYYFWLLAGLSFANLVVYVACAVRYRSKKAS